MASSSMAAKAELLDGLREKLGDLQFESVEELLEGLTIAQLAKLSPLDDDVLGELEGGGLSAP